MAAAEVDEGCGTREREEIGEVEAAEGEVEAGAKGVGAMGHGDGRGGRPGRRSRGSGWLG